MTNQEEKQMPDQQEQQLRKPFAAFVQEARNGALHDDLSTGLADLVAACVETGKKGTLTLKVTVAPQKDEVTILVTDDVTVKIPRHESKPALFFHDDAGNLLRNDPRQLDLASLREVPGGKATEPRDVRAAEGQAS
jgi:hypothetical protein